jgi:hypothetical protein
MEIALYEALVVIGIGLIGLIGSFQLENQLSTMSMNMVMGPATWTEAVSLIMIVCGIIAAIGHFQKRKSVDASVVEAPRMASARGMILIAVLALWVAAVPSLGFSVGCFIFFPLLFYVSGFRPWFMSIASGVIMAVAFYVIFILGARLPVPKGVFGI